MDVIVFEMNRKHSFECIHFVALGLPIESLCGVLVKDIKSGGKGTDGGHYYVPWKFKPIYKAALVLPYNLILL